MPTGTRIKEAFTALLPTHAEPPLDPRSRQDLNFLRHQIHDSPSTFERCLREMPAGERALLLQQDAVVRPLLDDAWEHDRPRAVDVLRQHRAHLKQPRLPAPFDTPDHASQRGWQQKKPRFALLEVAQGRCSVVKFTERFPHADGAWATLVAQQRLSVATYFSHFPMDYSLLMHWSDQQFLSKIQTAELLLPFPDLLRASLPKRLLDASHVLQAVGSSSSEQRWAWVRFVAQSGAYFSPALLTQEPGLDAVLLEGARCGKVPLMTYLEAMATPKTDAERRTLDQKLIVLAQAGRASDLDRIRVRSMSGADVLEALQAGRFTAAAALAAGPLPDEAACVLLRDGLLSEQVYLAGSLQHWKPGIPLPAPHRAYASRGENLAEALTRLPPLPAHFDSETRRAYAVAMLSAQLRLELQHGDAPVTKKQIESIRTRQAQISGWGSCCNEDCVGGTLAQQVRATYDCPLCDTSSQFSVATAAPPSRRPRAQLTFDPAQVWR
jgi:hypothetical protein